MKRGRTHGLPARAPANCRRRLSWSVRSVSGETRCPGLLVPGLSQVLPARRERFSPKTGPTPAEETWGEDGVWSRSELLT